MKNPNTISNTEDRLPENLNAHSLDKYLFDAFGACGCTDQKELRATLVKLLQWLLDIQGDRVWWNKLFPEPGQFYLVMGMLEKLELAEHGISVRYAWLTDDGKRLLSALLEFQPSPIDES